MDNRLTMMDRRLFLSRRALHLILLPTEQCNFRCVYCYEDFELGEMSPEVVASVKALIERRLPELDQLSIDWFGGEPLLAWPVIVDVQEFARSCARGRGLMFSGGMTTNGSLLSADRFRRLLDLGVRTYQITLDGPHSVHNRYRVRRSGRGSFETIWKNLRAMAETKGKFRVVLRLQATRENLPVLPSFCRELGDAFGGDPRFELSLKPVRPLGGPNDAHLPFLAQNEHDLLDSLQSESAKSGLRAHPAPVEVTGALQGCYAAAANSYVVRSNGDLAKCTVAFNDPRNRVGRLHRDGAVELDTEKMLYWMRGVFSGDRETLECPAREQGRSGMASRSGTALDAGVRSRAILPVIAG